MMRKMKTMLAAMLIMMLAFANIAAAQAYLPGTYEGQGQGFGGAVTVTITVDENAITSVTAEGAQETAGIGDVALPKLAQQILDAQSAEIDGVAGATMTSGGAKEAAAKAIAAAKGETAEAVTLTPGTYTATKEGFQREHVTVSVTVDETSILDVQIVEVTDHPSTVTDVPCTEIPAAIVANQSYSVDGVTGATITSNAIKNAVRDCLEQAGGADAFSAPVEKAELVNGEAVEVDVLVIGGGAAGMVAAAEAYRDKETGEPNGLKVMLAEKAAFLGGNTSVSGGSFYFYENETGAADEAWRQDVLAKEKAHIAPMMREPFNEAMLYGETGVMPDTLKLFEDSGMTLVPMWGNLGVEPLPGEEDKKWAGSYITKGFMRYFPTTEIDVRLNTAATKLITDENGNVVGAQVKDKTSVYDVYAKKVILATGGFANNKELIAKYAPSFEDTLVFAAGTTTGDGLVMATEIGAGVVGDTMFGHIGADNVVGIRPDYALTFGFGAGVFMGVNMNGERFCDETMNRYEMYHKVLQQDIDTCWGIVDSDNANVQALADSQGGFVVSADTLEELAAKLVISADTLIQTTETYNAYVDGGKDEAFGCPVEMMDRVSVGPYYAWPIRPCGITSLVALTVDGSCRVLNEQGEVIENLYATGDLVLGSLLKYYTGGRGIGTAIYTGDLAAQTAKAEILGK